VRIPEQIQRLAIVIGVVVVATLGLRFYLIPRSIVDTTLHRATAVAAETARPVKFAGASTCADCHDDVATRRAKSFHKNVSCETCHGPAAQHAEAPGEMKPPAPRDRKFCPVCHAYDSSRPTGFPQINVTAHNPLKPCISCHNPHDPIPPRTPDACSACHGQIERTKAVSSHALLPCTTCHRAPDQHKRTPRAALPSVPDSRDFCATCHGKDRTPPDLGKDAPKIDVTSHGGRYLCWQCHYPHLPEGRGA
jgi:DnaJ-class molecular chaperone